MKKICFFALVAALSLTGCKKRLFNAGFDSERPAPVTSPEAFQNALFRSAQKAQSVFSQDDLRSFFDDESIQALRGSSIEAFWASVQMNVPLVWGLQRSQVSPVYLSRAGYGGIPRGGMILLGGDVFPEGFFRERASSLKLNHLMTGTPWFEWDRKNQAFVPRTQGGAERILNTIFDLRGSAGTITLYRGAGIEPVLAPAPDRDPYKSGESEYEQVMYFSSPSLNTALMWARPAVWSSAIPRQELLDSVRGPEPVVYVGFEYSYPEIAFLQTIKAPVPAFLKEKRAQILCLNKGKIEGRADTPSAAGQFEFCDSRWAETHTSGFPEPIVLSQTARLRSDALLKTTPVADSDLEEGYIVCRLKAGERISYTEAYQVENDQIWIHSTGIAEAWNCPRGFASNRFYVDKNKVIIDSAGKP